RIDDESAGGPARAPGHFRQELGGEPAGAALRAADRLAAAGELFPDRLGEGDAVGAVDEWRQDLTALCFDDGQGTRGGFLVVGEGRERRVVFGKLGAEPESDLRMLRPDGRDRFVEPALGDAV